MTRKSKREIERGLDEIDPNPYDEYPQLDTLAELLSYDWEKVEGEEYLYRRADNNQIHHLPPDFADVLEGLVHEGIKPNH